MKADAFLLELVKLIFSVFALLLDSAVVFRKHLRQYRESVRHAISIPHPSNAIISEKTDSEKG